MNQEYPKALYKGGVAYNPETGRGVPHQDMRVVNDAAEEEAANADGFLAAIMPEGDELKPERVDGDDLAGAGGDDTLGSSERHDDFSGQPGADAGEVTPPEAEPEHDPASV